MASSAAVPVPLPIAITHRHEAADLDEELFRQVLDCVCWRTVPRFAVPGRTAWYELPRPVRSAVRPTARFLAVKLKGVGAWNPDDYRHSGVQRAGRAARPVPPETSEYEATARLRHIGTTPDGELTEVCSEAAPYGGILHARALQEFDNAATLLAHGVPAIAPLAVVRYEGLSFRDRPMGAVLTLSPARRPYRMQLDALDEQPPDARAHFADLYRALGIDADPALPIVQWQALSAVAGRAGALLRRFAEAGLYRYSMALENLQFDRERGELFLTDLDSSRRLAELTGARPHLELLRDIAAALHKMAWRLHYFVPLDPWPLDRLQAHDPFAAFLRGYFHEVSSQTIDASAAPLWRPIVPHLFLRKRLRAELTQWTGEALRSLEVDRALFYGLAMILVQPLLSATPLARGFDALDAGDLTRRMARFLGTERADHLGWLLR